MQEKAVARMELDLIRLKQQENETERLLAIMEVKQNQMAELLQLKTAQIAEMESTYGADFFQDSPSKNISRSKSMDINTVVITSKKKLESIQQ